MEPIDNREIDDTLATAILLLAMVLVARRVIRQLKGEEEK